MNISKKLFNLISNQNNSEIRINNQKDPEGIFLSKSNYISPFSY
jgi:hypothetical protein